MSDTNDLQEQKAKKTIEDRINDLADIYVKRFQFDDGFVPQDEMLVAFRDSFVKAQENYIKEMTPILEKFQDYVDSIETQEALLDKLADFIVLQLESKEALNEIQHLIEKPVADFDFYDVKLTIYDLLPVRYLSYKYIENKWSKKEWEKVVDETIELFYKKPTYKAPYDFNKFWKSANKTALELNNTITANTNAIESFLIPKSRPIRKLWHNELKNNADNQITLFEVLEGEEKKPVRMTLSASIQDLPGVKGIKGLTAEEEAWHNAIYSRYRAGNEYITNTMIYRDVLGNDKAKLTPKQDKAIDDFIENAIRTTITIDNREEAKAKHTKSYMRVTDTLLSMAKIENVSINGGVTEKAWFIKSVPILGAYAEWNKQVTGIPPVALETGTRAEYLPLKFYILNEIYWLKNDSKNAKKRSNRFLFETIYKETGVKDTRVYQKRCRDQVIAILKHLKKVNEIKSYTLFYDGKDTKQISPKGFAVTFDKNTNSRYIEEPQDVEK